MKILHTADWHLGKRLDSFYRLDEQRDVLNEICEIADYEKVTFYQLQLLNYNYDMNTNIEIEISPIEEALEAIIEKIKECFLGMKNVFTPKT